MCQLELLGGGAATHCHVSGGSVGSRAPRPRFTCGLRFLARRDRLISTLAIELTTVS
jgi:hypothetical protein